MDRLGLEASYFPLPIMEFPPAPGQGAIAIACREDDNETNALLQSINHQSTYETVMLERELMRLMGGDCSSPVGIYVSHQNERMHLNALSLSKNGLVRRLYCDFIEKVVLESLIKIADYLMGVF